MIYEEDLLQMVSHIIYKFGNVSVVWQETVFKSCKETDLKKKFCQLWNSVVFNFGMTFIEENDILIPC